MTGYLPRELTPRMVQAMRKLPVVVLSGLRQTGKITLLQNEPALVRAHAYGPYGVSVDYGYEALRNLQKEQDCLLLVLLVIFLRHTGVNIRRFGVNVRSFGVNTDGSGFISSVFA